MEGWGKGGGGARGVVGLDGDGGAGVGVLGGLWVAGGRRVNTPVSLCVGCGRQAREAESSPLRLVWSH